MCINRSDDDDDQDQGGASTGRASLDKNHSVCNYTDLECLHYCFAISVRCNFVMATYLHDILKLPHPIEVYLGGQP